MQVTKTVPHYQKVQLRASPFKSYQYLQQIHNDNINYKGDNITELTMPTPVHSRIISDTYDIEHQYTNQQFTPNQKTIDLFSNFEQSLKNLFQVVPQKHQSLLLTCQNSYTWLKQILTHYQKQNHLDPYYFQMHAQSTETKNTLLKMLGQEQSMRNTLQVENEEMRRQIGKLVDTVREMNGELEDRECRMKLMGKEMEMREDEMEKLREKVLEKDKKLKELMYDKQIMRNDLNTIEQQMNELQAKNKLEMSTTKNKIKHFYKNKNNQQEEIISNHIENHEEELYRYLVIQAQTIQNQILNQ